MELGAFSMSLAVADLEKSRTFYENLGFEVGGGDAEGGWLILRQGSTVLGLFQGMFERNLLTFNPGWAQDATPLHAFHDVRDIQSRLKSVNIEPVETTDPDGDGPAHIVVVDPDGNRILIDQHVPRPVPGPKSPR